MPDYKFTARNKSGKSESGVITATSDRSAMTLLKERGLYVTNLKSQKENKGGSFKRFFTKKVNSRDISIWSNQFAAMYSAGVPIAFILKTLSEQTENKVFKEAQVNLLDDITQGISIGDGMEKYPHVFPELMINMFRVGESAGILEDSLHQVVKYYTQEHEVNQKMRTAMTYPIIVLVMALVVVWVLMTRMVPSYVEAYANLGSELPLPTRILIVMSGFLVNNGVFVLIGLAAIAAIAVAWSRTTTGKRFIDNLKLKMPIFNQLELLKNQSRFCRILSTLLHHGIDIISALRLVDRSISNSVICDVIQEAREESSRGESVANAFARSKYFPPLIVNMMKVDEEAGSMDILLGKAADLYEVDLINMSERFNTMIEPFVNLFLAVIVGGILIAVFVPMFSMYNMIL